MGHIAILCDDLQSRNSVAISHNVIKYTRAILLDPFRDQSSAASCEMKNAYQGSSYGRSDPFVLEAETEAMRDASECDIP
jgi:hypothetical protein